MFQGKIKESPSSWTEFQVIMGFLFEELRKERQNKKHVSEINLISKQWAVVIEKKKSASVDHDEQSIRDGRIV